MNNSTFSFVISTPQSVSRTGRSQSSNVNLNQNTSSTPNSQSTNLNGSFPSPSIDASPAVPVTRAVRRPLEDVTNQTSRSRKERRTNTNIPTVAPTTPVPSPYSTLYTPMTRIPQPPDAPESPSENISSQNNTFRTSSVDANGENTSNVRGTDGSTASPASPAPDSQNSNDSQPPVHQEFLQFARNETAEESTGRNTLWNKEATFKCLSYFEEELAACEGDFVLAKKYYDKIAEKLNMDFPEKSFSKGQVSSLFSDLRHLSSAVDKVFTSGHSYDSITGHIKINNEVYQQYTRGNDKYIKRILNKDISHVMKFKSIMSENHIVLNKGYTIGQAIEALNSSESQESTKTSFGRMVLNRVWTKEKEEKASKARSILNNLHKDGKLSVNELLAALEIEDEMFNSKIVNNSDVEQHVFVLLVKKLISRYSADSLDSDV